METLRKLIEERAFDMWEARMQWGIPGDHLSDWLQSEKEIMWLHNTDKEEHAKQFTDVFGITKEV